MTRRTSGILDLLRWASAFAVVVTHTANLMVARITATPQALRTPVEYFWIFSAGFGHQAVVTFFVLSGFLVGGPLIATARRDQSIPWKKYLVDRLVRIYLVLIPALVVCFVLDRITYHIRPEWVATFIQNNSSSAVFIGNLLNFQNFWVTFFGSDGPIGTLAMEMWYYISFPLFLAAFCTSYSRRRRVLLVLLAVALNTALGVAQPAYLLGFVIWGIGAAARVARVSLFSSATIPTTLLAVTLLTIRAVMRRQMSENLLDLFIADLALAIALYAFLSTILRLPETTSRWILWPGHKALASFSYSLYATHMPMLFLLTALSKAITGFGIVDVVTRPIQWLFVLAAMSGAVLFAYTFSLVTERHTSAARKAVSGMLGFSRVLAAPEHASASSR